MNLSEETYFKHKYLPNGRSLKYASKNHAKINRVCPTEELSSMHSKNLAKKTRVCPMEELTSKKLCKNNHGLSN